MVEQLRSLVALPEVPESFFQHSHGRLKSSVTPVSGIGMSSSLSGTGETHAHARNRDTITRRENTYTHKIKINFLFNEVVMCAFNITT